MLTLPLFVIVASALLAEVCVGITEQCTRAATRCTAQQIQDQNNNVPPCTEGPNYFNCFASALAAAEASGVCDTLMVATYRRRTALDASVYNDFCPGFKIPPYLLLDACGKETGDCGASVTQAFVANNKNNLTDLCRNLLDFKLCMEGNTPSCSNRSTINSLLERELTVYNYETNCTKTSTSLPPTTKTTTTATDTATPQPKTSTTTRTATTVPTPTPQPTTTRTATTVPTPTPQPTTSRATTTTPTPTTSTTKTETTTAKIPLITSGANPGGATEGTGSPASNAPASYSGHFLLLLLLLTVLVMTKP